MIISLSEKILAFIAEPPQNEHSQVTDRFYHELWYKANFWPVHELIKYVQGYISHILDG